VVRIIIILLWYRTLLFLAALAISGPQIVLIPVQAVLGEKTYLETGSISEIPLVLGVIRISLIVLLVVHRRSMGLFRAMILALRVI
jgi:hypothetical protein